MRIVYHPTDAFFTAAFFVATMLRSILLEFYDLRGDKGNRTRPWYSNNRHVLINDKHFELLFLHFEYLNPSDASDQ
jgi:hypothetical protein